LVTPGGHSSKEAAGLGLGTIPRNVLYSSGRVAKSSVRCVVIVGIAIARDNFALQPQ